MTMDWTNPFPAQRVASRYEASWNFESEPRSADEPGGAFCRIKRSCHAEALPLVDYGLAVDPTNRVQAPGEFKVEVNVSYAPGVNVPKVNGATVWVSYDGGGKWTKTVSRRTSNGSYEVTSQHPPISRTSGAVSLRTEAWDENGSSVRATLYDAYLLREAK